MSLGDHVVGYAVAFALGVVAMDYAHGLKADDEARQEAAKAKPQARMEPAPIWLKRCIKQGKSYNAAQADGKRWRVECYGKGTRA